MSAYDPKRAAELVAMLREIDDPHSLLPVCSVRYCPDSADPRWAVYLNGEPHPACDGHGGDHYDAERLRDPLPKWPRREPLSAAERREVASQLEAAQAEMDELCERLRVIDRPAAQYACVACGATMQTWQEFPEYQHSGCGGLVRLRAVIERDAAIAQRDALRGALAEACDIAERANLSADDERRIAEIRKVNL